MLQHQIMFKKLQELQRRQQVQELSGARHQDYVDELTSSRQASPFHQSIRDSRTLMFDNMQTVEQGESTIFQGFPNGLVLSQGHSNALGPIGMPPQQFDTSLYGIPAPNTDKNLNLCPYHHGPSNSSANPSNRNNNNALVVASSFMSQQGNFSADQSPMPDGSLLVCQMYNERNLFGKVSFNNSNSNPLAASSLDPLEQKILYSSDDDHGWLSSFGTGSEMGGGDFDSSVENPSFMDSLSIQNGGWSALMHSAVTETSNSDTAVQEEWSGLSFQNPEPSGDNQPSNWSNGKKLQDNWVDRNFENVSTPSSEPEQLFLTQNMNCNYPSFQHLRKQYLKQNDEFQCESSYISGQCSPRHIDQTDYNSQLKHPNTGNQLVQTSVLYKENIETVNELKDTFWCSNPISVGSQMPFDQLNQHNFHKYSVGYGETGRGDNADPLSAHLGSSDPYGQNVAAQSNLPTSQGFLFRAGPADSMTPQSHSLFPSFLVMGKNDFSSTNYLQSSQKMESFGKNDSHNHSIDNKEASGITKQSQISLQMAPSWFKQYGNLKNGQNAIAAMQPLSGLSVGNVVENRLIMQVDSSNTAQASGICPFSAVNLIEHVSPPSMSPSDVTSRKSGVSNLKKRKIVAFDLVPWHTRLNCEATGPQNISMAESEWARALDRRREEARNEAEIVDDVVRAKRRLVLTTQLMQQVFRPSTAALLFGEATSNCHYLTYSAAITTLGDACNLNCKMPSDSSDLSSEKLKTWQRTAVYDSSKKVECLIYQAEKLEGDLSRMDGSLSVADMKVESQELEKFCILNRFAKFHFKAHPTIADPAAKTTPRRYVIAVQIPNTLPEGRECISL